jgi:hypothetical protein
MEKEIKVKKDLIIVPGNRDLQVLDYGASLECGEGKYRVIGKCRAGFMTSNDVQAKSPIAVFRLHKAKAIQSIAFIREVGHIGEQDFTVFARSGKKIWAHPDFLREVTVGDINQDLSKTALYGQKQYQAVNANSWADKAYVMNEEKK